MNIKIHNNINKNKIELIQTFITSLIKLETDCKFILENISLLTNKKNLTRFAKTSIKIEELLKEISKIYRKIRNKDTELFIENVSYFYELKERTKILKYNEKFMLSRDILETRDKFIEILTIIETLLTIFRKIIKQAEIIPEKVLPQKETIETIKSKEKTNVIVKSELSHVYENHIHNLKAEDYDKKYYLKYLLTNSTNSNEIKITNLIALICHDLTKSHISHLSVREKSIIISFMRNYNIKATDNIIYDYLCDDYTGGFIFLCLYAVPRTLLLIERYDILCNLVLSLEAKIQESKNINHNLKVFLELNVDKFIKYLPSTLPDEFTPIEIVNHEREIDYNITLISKIKDTTFVNFVSRKRSVIKQILPQVNLIALLYNNKNYTNITHIQKEEQLFLEFFKTYLTSKAVEDLTYKLELDPSHGILLFSYYYCWKHRTQYYNYHKLIHILSKFKTFLDLKTNVITNISEETLNKQNKSYFYYLLEPLRKQLFLILPAIPFEIRGNFDDSSINSTVMYLFKALDEMDDLSSFFITPALDYNFNAYIKQVYNKNYDLDDVGNLISLLFEKDPDELFKYSQLTDKQKQIYIEFLLKYVSPQIILYSLKLDFIYGGMFLLRYYTYGLRQSKPLNTIQLQKLLKDIRDHQKLHNIKGYFYHKKYK